jgi:hypothetical protein
MPRPPSTPNKQSAAASADITPRPPGLRAVAANFARLSHQQLLKTGSETAIFADRDIEETMAMRIFTAAAVMLALMAMPAHAQVNGKRHQGDAKKDEPTANKIDEKAYKAALEKIPDSKEKYDPWGSMRPAEPAKKPK